MSSFTTRTHVTTIAAAARQAQKVSLGAVAQKLRSTLVGLVVAGFAVAASATPLSLSYTVQSNGSGLFAYDFALSLDNNDGSWRPGHSFNWIIFGDARSAASPLTGFLGSNAPAPFTGFTTSGGGHNGPTFLGNSGWVPSALGDTLRWTGTSSAQLGQGQLFFSNLMGSGVRADYAVARLGSFSVSNATAVPEPATSALVLAAVAASIAATRKRRVR